MIVSHRHAFVFVPNSKTGISSVRSTLGGLLGPEDLHDVFVRQVDGTAFRHLPAREIRERVGAERYDAYFSFGFVRNPWDLLVSLYHYAVQKGEPVVNAFVPCFERPAAEHYLQLRRSGSFACWIKSDYFRETPHGTQRGVFADAEGRQLVDFIGRFERLEADFRWACSQVGLRANLRHRNRSRRPDYRACYDAESRTIVAEAFSSDIESFGYAF